MPLSDFAVPDHIRTGDLRKQSKNASFRHFKEAQADAPKSIRLVSDVYDCAVDFAGYSMLAPGIDALKLLADEFTIALHWNTNTFVVAPILSVATFRVETVDPDAQPPAGSQTPEFVLCEPLVNVSDVLSGPPVQGFRVVIKPGTRIVRFVVDATTDTLGDPRPTLTMQIQARGMAPYLLWEMSHDLRSIARDLKEGKLGANEVLRRLETLDRRQSSMAR